MEPLGNKKVNNTTIYSVLQTVQDKYSFFLGVIYFNP